MFSLCAFLLNQMFCSELFVFTFQLLFGLGFHKQKEEEYIANCGFKELLGRDAAGLA